MPETPGYNPEIEGEPIPLVRKKETREAMDAMPFRAEARQAAEALARLATKEAREKLTPEEREEQLKAPDVVMERTEKMAAATRAFDAAKEKSLRTEEAQKVFAAADSLRTLAEVTDATMRHWGTEIAEQRRPGTPGELYTMRIMVAQDAIRSYETVLGDVIALGERAPTKAIKNECIKLYATVMQRIGRAEEMRDRAEERKAEMMEVAAGDLQKKLGETRDTWVQDFPVAANADQTRPDITHAMDNQALLYAGLESSQLGNTKAEVVLSALADTMRAVDTNVTRVDSAVAGMSREAAGSDWQAAAVASKEAHEFSKVLDDAMWAHHESVVSKEQKFPALEYAQIRLRYAQIRLRAAEDAERVYGAMMDLAVERRARRPESEKREWNDAIDRLRRAIDEERAHQNRARTFIEIKRTAAAE